MASEDWGPPRHASSQAIHLQDLSPPRSPRRTIIGRSGGSGYHRLDESSPSPPSRSPPDASSLEGLQSHPTHDISASDPPSPVDDPRAFSDAIVGVSLSSTDVVEEPSRQPGGDKKTPLISITTPGRSFAALQTPIHESQPRTSLDDGDTAPLTGSNRLSVHRGGPDASPISSRPSLGSRLGDKKHDIEEAYQSGSADKISSRHGRIGSRSAGRRSRSPSPSAGISPISIFRMMSKRVVNLSNDSETVEQSIQRKASNGSSRLEGPPVFPAEIIDRQDGSNQGELPNSKPLEKTPVVVNQQQAFDPSISAAFLLGKSLCIFGPESKMRTALCEMLVHPITEPFILVCIVVQTVLLAVDSAHSVEVDPRSNRWGTSPTDFALLVLFTIYTLEIIARTIVSGFVLNPREHSTIDRSQGWSKGIFGQVRKFFVPQQQEATRQIPASPTEPSIVRTFTGLQPQVIETRGQGRHQQRIRLAKRAYLRHSFNRTDFIAVVSFWISFGLAVSGLESEGRVYVFRMLSALRILRLLGLTSGTSVILRSLKKAAPLLVNVAFLIGFFWLIFAIVGLQSFKASLRRTCVWLGQENQKNYTQNAAPDGIQFCGGHLDIQTGEPMPWIKSDGQAGAEAHKGYLCPQGSLCVEGENPYEGTVTFDNVGNSLQLVFVVMSSNTFSEIMYYLTDSDNLAAALFFAAAIIIMTLWLMNLLVAVITSSFQIIREESHRSAFTAEEIETEPVVDNDPVKKTSLKRLYDRTYWFWVGLIVLDLVVMCLRSSSMDGDREKLVDTTEVVVTMALLLEIMLRILSNWREFAHSKRNWFDLLLAVVTAIILLPPIRNSGQAYAWLTAFQIARIYRVVLAFSVTRDLTLVVFRNIGGLINLIIFVFLITFLAAILASQLFRGEIPPQDENGEVTPVAFFDIFNSFIGMYQVLSSEDWTSLMFRATQSGYHVNTAWLSAIFFIMWFILAHFIILNMFIAVIQESFELSEDEKRLQQVKAFLQKKELGGSSQGNLPLSYILKPGKDSGRRRDPLDCGPVRMDVLLKEAVVKEFLEERDGAPTRKPTEANLVSQPVVKVNPGALSAIWGKITRLIIHREPNPFYSKNQLSRAYEELDPEAVAREVSSAAEQAKRTQLAQRQYLARHPHYNVSLYLFSPDNALRRLCQRIVGPGRGERVEGVEPYKAVWYLFSAVIYLAIVAMVMIACVTTPLYQRRYYQVEDSDSGAWFVWADLSFAVFFTIEAAIKAIADGLFFTPNAYFRGAWGFIDGIVLITLWISVATSLYRDDDISRAVGAFKALRALRLLNISDSARDTFYSVIVLGGWKVLSAAFVSINLLIPFAILGLNLFHGQMESCNDGNFGSNDLSNCVGEYNSTPYNWTVLAPRQASNPPWDFDNFGNSLFILFQIVSQEGWTDVMWSAMSITGPGSQPQPFAAQGNAVFFIIFNLLGAVFVLTLFVSVFMRNYTEQTGVAFLTADQRAWLELRKLLKQISPSKRPRDQATQGWRRWCYRRAVQKHGLWARLITSVLVFHLVLLVVEFYPSVHWWDVVRDFLFLASALLCIANIIIRIVGLSWHRFRRSSWDLYSIPVVSGVLLTTILALLGYEDRVFRILHKCFLVSITFLLIPRNDQLDHLFKTAAASLTKISNLLATWLVLFLVYAIAFTQTFGLTRLGENETGNLNFRDVPRALILLFRMSCGEGWNEIMEDFAGLEPPYCVWNENYFKSDCGSAAWARALFISWNIISMYIFVSLFVSLIFESFSYVYQRSSDFSVISREEIRRFKQAWAEFDPDGTKFISKEDFPRLLRELSGHFHMGIYDGDFSVRRILEDCRVQSTEFPRTSVHSGKIVEGVDLDLLNERLRRVPAEDIRRRRALMTIFYEEIMVSADPERGISFTSLLMTLAHYNVISDTKSLRLEEFLRRRARLQRVEEAVCRNVVIGFFDTIYWSREFRREQSKKGSATVGGPLQIPVPEIFVEDPDDADAMQNSTSSGTQARDFTQAHTALTPTRSGTYHTSTEPTPDGGVSRDSAESTRDDRGRTSRSPSPAGQTRAPRLDLHRTPLQSIDTAYHGSGGRRSGDGLQSALGLAPSHSRAGSSVSALDVLHNFEGSAWGESIRRSFSMRRSHEDGSSS